MPENANHQELTIQIEQLPAAAINNKHLKPITDNKILTHINNLLPELFQAGNALKSAIPANAPDGPVLYQAIIPAGAKLSDSKDMPGAVRGFYRNETGIQGHANFVAAELNTGKGSLSAAVSSAMSVASMVVGQYYMAQINTKLLDIRNDISQIINFQDNEYKSRVFALLTQIKKIASFQFEILKNDELRKNELISLDRFEQQCIELLNQANRTISQSCGQNLEYCNYEKEVKSIHNWYSYQRILLNLLFEIAKLKYALHFGTVSKDYCYAASYTCSEDVKSVLSQLKSWHQVHAGKLGIDKQLKYRKRDGVDGVIYKIPGVLNKKYNFCPIPRKIKKIIKSQKYGYSTPKVSDLFQQDVKLIIEGEKLYYLPEY